MGPELADYVGSWFVRVIAVSALIGFVLGICGVLLFGWAI